MQRNTGYFPTESLEPSINRLFSRSALNEGYLFRGSLDKSIGMISSSTSTCPTCGGKLKPYDKVLRIVRTKGRKTKRVSIRRLRCTECGGLHREIPQYICPYKQYEKDVIQGVLEGLITCETLGYEDYPCEMTMRRWLASHKLRLLLWRNP